MKSYVKNTIVLSLCIIISKVIGAIYKILLSNILGTQGMGIYQLIFPVYALALVIITGGMPIYISQRVAFFRAKKQPKEISNLLKNCFALCVLMGVLFAGVFVVFGRQIARLQGNEFAYLGYITVGVSIVFSSTTCVIRGYFLGIENATPNALSTIIENLCKFLFGILFSFLFIDYGLEYAVAGSFIGILLSEFVSFVYMIIKYKQRKPRLKSYISYNTIKSVFVQFIPLSLTSIILPMSACIDSFLVVNLLSIKTTIKQATSLFGIATGMVSPIISFPVILFGTIATAFLPSLTFAIEQKKEVKQMIGGTYFFSWLFSLPCAIGIFVLAPIIIKLCFPAIEGNFIKIASIYLNISCFNIIFLSIMQISNSILNSLHKFYLPFFCQLTGLIVKFVSFVLLVLFTDLGIISLGISILFSNALSCLLVVLFVKNSLRLNLNIFKFFIPLLSVCIMSVVIVVLNKYFVFNDYIKLFLSISVGSITYFLICLLLRTIKISEIKSIFSKQNSNGNLT